MQKSVSWDRLSSYSIGLILAVIIVFSPLIYGGVTILPLSIVEALSFSVFLILAIKLLISPQALFIKSSVIPFVLFVSLALFQLVSLPEWFISIFSPATTNLFRSLRVNPLGGISLSIYPEATVSLLLQVLSFLAVFLVALNYIDTEKKGKRIIKVIIFSGLIYSIYGIIKKSCMPKSDFSTFTNYNHFSTYVQMIIPLGLAYSLSVKSNIKRVILLFVSSVMIIALFYSWSRAGRVSFILSIAVFFILLSIKKPLGKFAVTIFFLLFFLAVFIGLIGLGPLLTRMQTFKDLFNGYEFRVGVILDTLRILRDFPVFGTGLGTYAEIAQKYKTTTIQYSYGFSHNELVQLLSEVGIAGFLLMGLFLIKSFMDIFSAWFKRKNDYAVFVTIACMVGMFSAILHSLLDFVFHVPANFILFALILALAYRAAYTSKNQDYSQISGISFFISPIIRIVLAIIFSVFFIYLIFFVINRSRAQLIFDDLKESKFVGSNVDLIVSFKKAIRGIDKAISLNPLNSSYVNKKGDLFADLASKEGLERELSALEEFGSREKLLLEAQKFYLKSININPTKADYHLRLGWLYDTLEQVIPAREEFNKAILLDPKNRKIEAYVKNYLDNINKEPS